MQIVNKHLARSIREQGMIREPNSHGYVLLAGEVEKVHPLKKASAAKKRLLTALKVFATELNKLDGVREATVFSAFLIPPGSKEARKVLVANHYDVHVAKFDIVILVECEDVGRAHSVRDHEFFRNMKAALERTSSYVHCFVADNPHRIDEVDHGKDGIFLFNYFYTADPDQARGAKTLLDVWEFTAGWWTAKANLTNSVPVRPVNGENSEYALVNHCRWDRILDVLPSLLFKPSMRKFVLKNFTANDIVAMPILYRLA